MKRTLPLIATFVIILGLVVTISRVAYIANLPTTAIVDATVLSVSAHPTIWEKYLLNVNLTRAFPNAPFSVRSQCYHAPGEHLFVGVEASWDGHLLNGNATGLFKGEGTWIDGGPTHFVPWDGCGV